jgi:hypothetical protein
MIHFTKVLKSLKAQVKSGSNISISNDEAKLIVLVFEKYQKEYGIFSMMTNKESKKEMIKKIKKQTKPFRYKC